MKNLIPLLGTYRVDKRAYGKYAVQKKYGFLLWSDEWFCDSEQEAKDFIKSVAQ